MKEEFNLNGNNDLFLDRIILKIFNKRKRKFEYVLVKKDIKKKSPVYVIDNGLANNQAENLVEEQNKKKKPTIDEGLAEIDLVNKSGNRQDEKQRSSDKKQEELSQKIDESVLSNEDVSKDRNPVFAGVDNSNKTNDEKVADALDSSVNVLDQDMPDNEITEIILEEQIVGYFEELLKENRYKLNKLVAEYNQHLDEYDKLLLYDDAVDHSNNIEVLLARIQKIKDELELLKNSFNLDEAFRFDDNYIVHLMDEYRTKFNNQFDEKVLEDVRTDSEYLSLMAQLYLLDKFTMDLQDEVTHKMGEFKERDKDFEEFSVTLDEKDKSFEQIEHMIKNSDSLIKDLEDKVNNSKHVIERVEYITVAVNNNLNALLLGFTMIRNNPLVPATVKALMVTQIVLASFQRMMGRTERRVHREVVVDNYEREILDGLESIDDIFTLIDDTMGKIVDLRKEFEEKFKGYDIPEYYEALDKLDQLSKNISERRDYLSYTKKEFNEQLDQNNAKVKRLDYDEENSRVDDVA